MREVPGESPDSMSEKRRKGRRGEVNGVVGRGPPTEEERGRRRERGETREREEGRRRERRRGRWEASIGERGGKEGRRRGGEGGRWDGGTFGVESEVK